MEVGEGSRTGDVIQSIVGAAKDLNADLIVMSTDGRKNFSTGSAAATAKGSASRRCAFTYGPG
jgi:nucleotide-binding universal stress UspA family protein